MPEAKHTIGAIRLARPLMTLSICKNHPIKNRSLQFTHYRQLKLRQIAGQVGRSGFGGENPSKDFRYSTAPRMRKPVACRRKLLQRPANLRLAEARGELQPTPAAEPTVRLTCRADRHGSAGSKVLLSADQYTSAATQRSRVRSRFVDATPADDTGPLSSIESMNASSPSERRSTMPRFAAGWLQCCGVQPKNLANASNAPMGRRTVDSQRSMRATF